MGSSPGIAQDYCSYGGGGFTTAPSSGCAPLTVTVTNTVAGANPANIQYYFNYKPSDALTGGQGTTYTYTTPGSYTILQIGTGPGKTLCRSVTVLNSTVPDFRIIACGDKTAKVILTDNAITQQYDQIEIVWNDGSTDRINKGSTLEKAHTYASAGLKSIQVRGLYNNGGSCSGSTLSPPKDITISNQELKAISIQKLEFNANGSLNVYYQGLNDVESEVTIQSGNGNYSATGIKNNKGGRQQLILTGLNPQQQYCIRLSSSDACGNVVYSNEVCTVVATATAQSDQNSISWNKNNSASAFSKYEILKDGNVSSTSATQSEITYTDTDVECGISYSYQVKSYTAQDTSISAPVTISAISNKKPGVVSSALVSVENSGSVQLLVLPPATGATTNYKMIFERVKGQNTNFAEIATITNANQLTDTDVQTSSQNYCYRIIYENACGIRSDPSESICTILLYKKDNQQIGWTKENPFLVPIDSYTIIKINANGSSKEIPLPLVNTFDTNLDPPTNQEYNYQVQAVSADGFFMSYSNIIDMRKEPHLFIPNAFSPNDDGKNDTFQINANFLTSSKMTIYDRWGTVIFATDDATKGWNGTLNSQNIPAPPGNYIYKLELVDSTGKTIVKTGALLLIR